MSRHHQMRVKQRRRWQRVRQRGPAIVTLGAVRRVLGFGDDLEVHHIVPLHQGGDGYDLSTISKPLCRGCHVEITSKDNRRKQLTPGEDAWHAAGSRGGSSNQSDSAVSPRHTI